MGDTVDTFYVISNYLKDPELETAGFIREYLESKGKKCYISQREDGVLPVNY